MASIAISGPNAAEFAIVTAGGSACPVSNGILAAAASCMVGVGFAPQSAGSKTATLRFTDNAAGSPQTVTLTGSAISPATVQVSPAGISFAPQSVGIASAPQVITVSNTGSSPLAINGVSITGSNTGDFSQTNNCPPSLGAAASCLISISFDPAFGSSASRSATVMVADNAAGSPQTVSLSGTAVQASLSLTPSSINFGGQLAGTSSAPQTITVTNTGTGALSFSGIRVTSTNAADFTIAANACSPGSTPAASGCAIQIAFAPTCVNGAAARTATLALSDNAPGSPQNIALSGMATGDFCFDPPAGATTATVTAGQTAVYSLAVFSPNSYSGSVSFACPSAPLQGACTVSPATATLPAQITVSVATTANSAQPALRFHPPDLPRLSRLPRGTFAPAVLALLAILALFSFLRHSRRERFVSAAPVFLLLVVSLLLISLNAAGCGGGAGATADPPGTPAQTYSLMLTGAAADGTTASLNLTLIVH